MEQLKGLVGFENIGVSMYKILPTPPSQFIVSVSLYEAVSKLEKG
jgi:hypothetical protein